MSNSFDTAVMEVLQHSLQSASVQTIQVNLGLLCNLNCRHCHVEASPQRVEIMTWPTMESVLRLSKALPGARIDMTGGAPELNPHFRRFVSALRDMGRTVQVRTNLSVFYEPEQVDTPDFLANQQVQLVASMPCYLDENVDGQRGKGTFKRNIAALRRLNSLGYGHDDQMFLNLVYNPGGAFLPPDQTSLEAAYRRELQERYGIVFNRLLTIANMPLGRFMHDLKAEGKARSYQTLLKDNFNPDTLQGLMCRHQICVSWDGRLADCDFNLALGLSLAKGLPGHIDQLDPATLTSRDIVTDLHCFGCTAGCGSSCGGALVA